MSESDLPEDLPYLFSKVTPPDPDDLPPVKQVQGETVIYTHFHDDGTVNIMLEAVDPAHIKALFKMPFAASVEQVVWAHAAVIAQQKAEGQ